MMSASFFYWLIEGLLQFSEIENEVSWLTEAQVMMLHGMRDKICKQVIF